MHEVGNVLRQAGTYLLNAVAGVLFVWGCKVGSKGGLGQWCVSAFGRQMQEEPT